MNANSNIDYLWAVHANKYNETVKITEEDKKSKVRILCKEPYAQSVYDKYFSNVASVNSKKSAKDLELDSMRTVRLVSYNAKTEEAMCEDVDSLMPVFVKSQDLHGGLNEYLTGKEFNVHIVKMLSGSYYGSVKKSRTMAHINDMTEMAKNQTPFEVTITELVKGGYMATYEGMVNCFLPGSHAAANVISDFASYLGKTIPVVIDNYDNDSGLYVVSYKKYITVTLPEKIKDIEFGKEYIGHLTNKPSDFGVFVEIDNYYTGLIHKTEFKNYNEIRNTMKTGDAISCYVKDVNKNDKGQLRIILTTNKAKVSHTKIEWQERKTDLQGKYCDYLVDGNKFYIITPDNSNIPINIDSTTMGTYMYTHKNIMITDVDVINENIHFVFSDKPTDS
jgi:predicted RNA-binding protein with RPS1 domain